MGMRLLLASWARVVRWKGEEGVYCGELCHLIITTIALILSHHFSPLLKLQGTDVQRGDRVRQ